MNEEERKAKEKGYSCVHLFLEQEFAFVLEGGYFYYVLITGCILSESTLFALLQAKHAWGSEVHQMQPNGKVGQKLNLSQSPDARFQQTHSQFKGLKKSMKGYRAPRYKLQLVKPPGPSLQVPAAVGRSCSCSFPSAPGLPILIRNRR